MSLLEQPLAVPTPLLLERLSVAQFHRMLETGILREGDSIELIDGLLVRKDRSDVGGNPMSHGPRHALCLKRLERQLRPVEPCGFHLHVQLPITVSATSEPDPDVAVVRGRAEDYEHQHPGPQDVALVVEVADSSLDYDRTTKVRTYARAGIPVYWIVNIRDKRIEVYESPDTEGARYRQVSTHGLGQIVQVFEEGTHLTDVAVQDLLT